MQADLDAVDRIIADGDLASVDDDPMAFFLPIVLRTAFQMPGAHPGPVPPTTP